MSRAPLYGVDYAAGSRLSAQVRARNKEVAAEYDASLEKISGALRAWQIALHRSTQFLEAFEEVR